MKCTFLFNRFLFLKISVKCTVITCTCKWVIIIPVVTQHAKKVLASDSMGQVDFANRLRNSVLNLPTGK